MADVLIAVGMTVLIALTIAYAVLDDRKSK